MDRALLALGDSKAMIVDIALNDGRYDRVSAEVAGSLADTRRLAFTVRQQRPQGNETKSYFFAPKGSKQLGCKASYKPESRTDQFRLKPRLRAPLFH